MLSEILKALIITSLAGSLLTLVIVLIKPFTKKFFGYSWHYYIWLAVLITMLLPVRFYLPASGSTVFNLPAETIESEQVTNTDLNQITPQMTQIEPKESDLRQGSELVRRMWDGGQSILVFLWLTGAVFLLLVNLIGYIRLILKIRRSSVIISCPETLEYTKKKITVRTWKNLSSPFMIGLFKPTLVLPEAELTKEQLHNVLRHEMTHFKRKDILYKWFAVIVKCIHWFNPFVWYVTRQISIECEISCDMTVIKEMDQNEKVSYMSTILALLESERVKSIPLTTGMTGNKKVLKRRFLTMQTKKATGKIMSALSVLIAALVFSVTVFASGVISGLIEDSYTILVMNNGKVIEFENKPFNENGIVYLPLREALNYAQENAANGKTSIQWNNGEVILQNDIAVYSIQTENDTAFNIRPVGENYNSFVQSAYRSNSPKLKNSLTYMSVEDINYIVYGIMTKGETYFDYVIYDKNGEVIDGNAFKNEPSVVKISNYENNTPEYTVDQFFYLFSSGDFENMKKYCTKNCEDNFFGDGYCFGMTKASLAEMNIDPLEYAKSSNDFILMVDVNMTPHEGSVFYPEQTETSFYMILMRQPDGRYLIDEFATGL